MLESSPSQHTLASPRPLPPVPNIPPPIPSLWTDGQPKSRSPSAHSSSTGTQASIKDKPQPIPVYSPEIDSVAACEAASLYVHPRTPPLGYYSRGVYTGRPTTEHWLSQLVGGRERFPERYPFEKIENFSGQFQAVHPTLFDSNDFARIWDNQPLCLDAEDISIKLEEDYCGALYRIRLTQQVITTPVKRGTVIVLGGHDQPEIRYVATVCRARTTHTSLIQVNAYMEDQHLFRAENPDWPAFLLVLPNHLSDVPIHPELLPYHRQTINGTFSRLWGRIRQFIHNIYPTRTNHILPTTAAVPLSRI